MNLSRPFILRPVGTTLLMLAILMGGVVAFPSVPVSALPEVEYPTIAVQTFQPGASPEVMTTAVTAPLERQFGQMPGLSQMSSSSSAGASAITLQFTLGLSLDVAEQEVQAAINAATSLLPSDLPAPPVYNKVNPADAPVLTLALTSRTMPLTAVEDAADVKLAQKISQLPGVGLVSIGGGNRPAVRVVLNPRALAAYGLAIDDVRTIIGNQNVDMPKGSFDGPAQSSVIDANDQIKTTAGYRALVIAYRNGRPVQLGDVARVVDGAENDGLAAWANSVPAVVLNIRRQPGSNVIAVVDGIKAQLPKLAATLPPAIDVAVLGDRTTNIRASVADVELELGLAVVLVVLVIFLFLRTLPATLIPSLSVPLSLVGTVAAMAVLGFSLDNLSLMALTVSTGFVVDDAIVMIENVTRYVEDGDSPLEAALRGSAEIGFTILTLTVSLIAVLIPLLFMGDVVGRLFREFAVILAITILLSAVVSLTLVPMMCALLVRHRPAEARSRIDLWAERGFDRVVAAYHRALTWVLDRQGLALLVLALTLALTGVLFVAIPKGFFPLQDTGTIQVVSYAPGDTAFAAMATRQRALADAILRDPAVDNLTSFIGVDGTNATPNTGRLLVSLKPFGTRDGAGAVIARLRAKVHVPGIALALQPVQDLTIDSTVGRAPYHFFLENPEAGQFASWVPKLLDRLRADPALQDVSSDMEEGQALDVMVDRATAARFGITMATVDNALYDAFGQRIVSTLYTQSSQYRVILQTAVQDGTSPQRVLEGIRLPSTTASSGQVPLSAIVKLSSRRTPLQVGHLGQFPAVSVSFDLRSSASLGQAVAAVRAAKEAAGLPGSFTLVPQGNLAAFDGSLANEVFLVLAALVAVYVVLGVLYENFVHPLTILSTLPAAGVGALLFLLLTGHELDVVAVIGIVLLIGIVKKNAIMMIDFALTAERVEGRAPRDAIMQACLLRLRPILMTTVAAMLSALPLVLGSGPGAELRRPLGIAIVGGLLVSQALTLFTTPAVFLAFDALAVRLTRRRPNIRRGDVPQPEPRPAG